MQQAFQAKEKVTMGREHTDTWFFFGDSITLGVNDNEQPGGYVSRLALLAAADKAFAMPPATFYNLGARRQTLSQIEARFEQEYTARLMPGIRSRLAFCTGTVDIKGGADPVQLSRDVLRLVTRAKDIAPTLFICPFPVADETSNKALATFAALAKEACRSLNVPCINIFDALLAQDFCSLLTDAVHPGPQGNALIARLLWAQPELKTFLTVED